MKGKERDVRERKKERKKEMKGKERDVRERKRKKERKKERERMQENVPGKPFQPSLFIVVKARSLPWSVASKRYFKSRENAPINRTRKRYFTEHFGVLVVAELEDEGRNTVVNEPLKNDIN